MLKTKSGKETICNIPGDRILLEKYHLFGVMTLFRK